MPSCLSSSLFIDAPALNLRLWAAELALQYDAVAAVIVDGRGMNMNVSRRLQVKARNSNALLLMTRPAAQKSIPSAAAMRWQISPTRSPDPRPRWTLELLRCKAMRPTNANLPWLLEWDGETAAMYLSTELAERPAQTSRPRQALRRRA